MIKAKRIFSVLVLMTAISLLAGASSSLFAQTAKESQAAQEASTAAAQTQAAQQKATQERRAAESQELTMRVKTYELKFISASEFMRSARFYVVDSTGTESSLTVRIYGNNIPEFEALLKKLDVEKRNIQFQVYTIIASKDQPLERFKNNFVSETQGIADKDLKRVLEEMKGLWNFKYYWVDSPSFLVVKDGAAGSMFKLVSPYDFDMNVLRVQLRGDEPGKRIISVGQIQLFQTVGPTFKLIDTSDVTFKEKGYLVVGVSGFQAGWSSSALILVISAEIK
jgi:hypothetical protein